MVWLLFARNVNVRYSCFNTMCMQCRSKPHTRRHSTRERSRNLKDAHSTRDWKRRTCQSSQTQTMTARLGNDCITMWRNSIRNLDTRCSAHSFVWALAACRCFTATLLGTTTNTHQVGRRRMHWSQFFSKKTSLRRTFYRSVRAALYTR